MDFFNSFNFCIIVSAHSIKDIYILPKIHFYNFFDYVTQNLIIYWGFSNIPWWLYINTMVSNILKIKFKFIDYLSMSFTFRVH